MKKLSVVLAIVTALAVIGCASSGETAGGGGDPYSVDLSTLKAVVLNKGGDTIGEFTGETVKNKDPFTQNYDDLMILFAEPLDVTKYSRVTINCKYFTGEGEEIKQGDSNAMVVLVYNKDGDKRGPAMGAGPNTPLKEFNVGGFSGAVSTEKGVRVRLDKPLDGILFQNSNPGVKFIEVTEITFHD